MNAIYCSVLIRMIEAQQKMDREVRRRDEDEWRPCQVGMCEQLGKKRKSRFLSVQAKPSVVCR